MRVAIDARYWRSAIQTGVERYVLLLLEALTAAGNGAVAVDLILTADEAVHFPADRYPDLTLSVLPVPDRRTATLNRLLREVAPDVVHFPFDLPGTLTHPSVFTLHDPGRYLFPELMVRKVRDVQNDRLRDQLRDPHLKAVVTVSNASRTDIHTALGELPVPVEVIGNFIPADFADQLRHARVSGHAAAAEPFLLAVGVYMPLKNIPRLCSAFQRARTLAPATVPGRLLLVGRRGWERGLPRGAAHGISTLGHVTDQHLAELYATTSAFVFPTLYEGFGMPVHEALAAGAPVLCSDIPVLREIGGDAVHYADPRDTDALAKALVRRCEAPHADVQGVERVLASYTAAVAGAALVDVYDRAAAGR